MTLSWQTKAQNVGINTTGATPDNSALLDISATDKGLLIPRMDSIQREAIANPAQGLLVFDNTANGFMFYNGSSWMSFGDADNMGNHIATQNLQLQDNWLSGDGDNEGIKFSEGGQIGIGTSPQANLHVEMAAGTNGFQVGDDGVTFNEYKFPSADGISGQVLATDGNGKVSWTDKAADTDAQALSLSGNTLSLNNDPTTIDLSAFLDNTDQQNLSLSGDSLSLSNDPNTIDLNFANTDEQDLSLSGNILSLTNGGSVDLGNLSFNDQQDLSLSGNTLSITNDTTSVDLSIYDDADNMGDHSALQNLQLNGKWLSGDGADEGLFVDANGQVAVGTANPSAQFHVAMSGGPGFRITADSVVMNNYTLPDTIGSANQALATDGSGKLFWKTQSVLDQQDLTISGNIISLTNDSTSVDLSGFYDNVDEQDLSLSGNTLSTSNSSLSVDLTPYINTDEQDLSRSGDTLFISNDANTVNLASFRQDMSFNNNSLSLTESSTTIDLSAYQQDLSLSGNTLSLSNNPASADLSKYAQDLSLSGNTLSLSDDTATVNLSEYINTDHQLLSLSGPYLYLENDPTPANLFTLSDSDNQDLALSGTTLTLTNSPSVDLSPYLADKNFGSHNAAQNIQLNDHWLNHDGTAFEGISINDQGQVGIGMKPEDEFNVFMSKAETGLFTTGNVPINADFWQSFTAPQTGRLTRIYVYAAINCTVKVYEGEGTSGTLLHSQLFSNGAPAYLYFQNVYIALTAGQKYTFDFDFHGTPTLPLKLLTDSYPGGRMSTSPNEDAFLEIWWDVNQSFKVAQNGVGIGRTPLTNMLEVEGNASKSSPGSWLGNSDARLKKHIQALSPQKSLAAVLALQGLSYEWDDQQTGTQRPDGIQYGFTAQNIQEQFPSLVQTDQLGFLQTAYGSFDAMMVASIHALDEKIETEENRPDFISKKSETETSHLFEPEEQSTAVKELEALKAEIKTLQQLMNREK